MTHGVQWDFERAGPNNLTFGDTLTLGGVYRLSPASEYDKRREITFDMFGRRVVCIVDVDGTRVDPEMSEVMSLSDEQDVYIKAIARLLWLLDTGLIAHYDRG